MKKFIATSPLQENLSCVQYVAIDNDALQFDQSTRFPVIPLLNAYVKEGEEIELIVLCHIGHEDRHGNYKDPSGRNYDMLLEELEALQEKKNFQCKVQKIEMEYDECIKKHLENFQNLIEKIEDGDELYACMSYGTKAVPMIEMMALNYAYRAKFNTHIGCIVYGATIFDKESKITDAKIYDMTPLFYMDEIVRKVADMKIQDPLETIRQVLEL
jgi:CRISPR-associated protein (cas_TM1812).